MKINLLDIDTESFNYVQTAIAGDVCYLIYPKRIGVTWTESNLHLRSSIWNTDGMLVSAGYKKFFNWEENPTVSPQPKSFKDLIFMEKIDGSLLSVSKYKGELIVRTRQTADARSVLKNGPEIELLMKKYPKAFEFNDETAVISRIFEWTTPSNKIILDYGAEPQLWLTGIINHEDYSYEYQEFLDMMAYDMGVLRPKIYKFNSFEEMHETVQAFKGIEGVCAYYNRDQCIRKVKGLDYLAKHRFKSEVNLDNIVDLFVRYGYPKYKDFEKLLIEEFDYECFEMARGFISVVCDAHKEASKIVEHMVEFIQPLKLIPRKKAATKIQQAYGTTNRCSFAFNILDGKEFKPEMEKKLIYQCIK